MALIVGGTTVTGTQTLQASTLTGTASAINGSNITSLPAPSTANVLSATAGLSLGAVGTYSLLRINGCSTTINEGEVVGVTLYWSGLGGQVNQGTASGTWRSLGYMTGCATTSGTVCVRIS
tara:strand:- start:593 stop:955 length:363 start_codon:yes stop_codon:yes gene_type:complete